MTYRLAPALRTLVGELDARWPDRDRRSDGWIGDAAHSARVSDHNPDGDGSVNAYDIDIDGIPVEIVLLTLLTDPRVTYLIFAGYIYRRATGFKPERYTGVNKHHSHLHVSISHDRRHEDSTAPWGLITDRPAARPGKPAPIPTQEEVPMAAFRIRVAPEVDGAPNASGGTIYLCQFGPPGVACFRYLSPDQNSDLARAGVELRPVTLDDGRTRDFSEYEKDHMRASIIELRDAWSVGA